MEGTVFASALEGMKHVKSEEGEMLTKQFLEVCKQIIPIIEKFGAAMALVKSDVGGNITRLENKYLTSPSEFKHLYSMVRVEVEAKTAKGSSSCTNGLLWLTRAMDFLVELFRDLLEHADWTMSQACTESYNKTLKKWHGWLASSSFSVNSFPILYSFKFVLMLTFVFCLLLMREHINIAHPQKAQSHEHGFTSSISQLAMKFAPDRKKFMDVVGGTGDINADIGKFCTNFSPLLEENHKFLASVGLDDLKAS